MLCVFETCSRTTEIETFCCEACPRDLNSEKKQRKRKMYNLVFTIPYYDLVSILNGVGQMKGI